MTYKDTGPFNSPEWHEQLALWSALGVLGGAFLTGNTTIGVGIATLIIVSWWAKYRANGDQSFFK